MSVTISLWRLRARPLTNNMMGAVMLRVYLRFSSSGLGLRRPASIASETYAGCSEACSEHHKMKNTCESVIEDTEKRCWCQTYIVVLNDI